MKQWDTYQWAFPHNEHPCVVLSPDARCTNPGFDTVNILGCSSHRSKRLPRVNEAMLDSADGMDWETLVRVDFIWTARKADLKHCRGAVTSERRREIGRKVIQVIGLIPA